MKKKDEHIAFARHLRRSSTEAEQALWNRIRNNQIKDVKFRRQQPLGPYTVDFICFEHRLIIEVDGGQHATTVHHDELRTNWFTQRGYKVMRFWNNEVLQNMEGVLQVIAESPQPAPRS